jgi:hypothetical protein
MSSGAARVPADCRNGRNATVREQSRRDRIQAWLSHKSAGRSFVVGPSNDRGAAHVDSACGRGCRRRVRRLRWGYLQRVRLMRQLQAKGAVRSSARLPPPESSCMDRGMCERAPSCAATCSSTDGRGTWRPSSAATAHSRSLRGRVAARRRRLCGGERCAGCCCVRSIGEYPGWTRRRSEGSAQMVMAADAFELGEHPTVRPPIRSVSGTWLASGSGLTSLARSSG